jgi:hypothetical protein
VERRMVRTISKLLLTCFYCLALLGWSGCALTSEDPSEQFFVKYFGEDGDQEGVDMLVATDGIYLLGNTTKQQAGGLGQQILLIKTDFQGNEMWRKSFGKSGKDEARDMEYTNTPNQIVMVGNLERAPGDQDCFIMTLDISPSGANRVDSVSFGYVGFQEKVNSVTQTSDGFVTAGSTTNITLPISKPDAEPTPDLIDAMNFRFNSNLTLYTNTWTKGAGFKASDESIKVFDLGTVFVMFGVTNSTVSNHPTANDNFWYVGLGSVSGEPSTSRVLIGAPNQNEVLSCVSFTSDPANEGYLLTGIVKNASSEGDVYVFKLKPTLGFNSGDRENDNVLQLSLGNVPGSKTAIGVAQGGGFFIVSNTVSPATGGSVDWLLTKVNPIGRVVWTTPFIFGGGGDDQVGAVQELPDGSILVFGTFEVGSDRREKKMTLIKLNKDGKLQPE